MIFSIFQFSKGHRPEPPKLFAVLLLVIFQVPKRLRATGSGHFVERKKHTKNRVSEGWIGGLGILSLQMPEKVWYKLYYKTYRGNPPWLCDSSPFATRIDTIEYDTKSEMICHDLTTHDTIPTLHTRYNMWIYDMRYCSRTSWLLNGIYDIHTVQSYHYTYESSFCIASPLTENPTWPISTFQDLPLFRSLRSPRLLGQLRLPNATWFTILVPWLLFWRKTRQRIYKKHQKTRSQPMNLWTK